MMEKVTVNIEDIADALEMTMDGWEQYMNMETGEIVSSSDGMWSDRNDEDEALAEEIDTTDKYVRLPNQYDIHEYEIGKVVNKLTSEQ